MAQWGRNALLNTAPPQGHLYGRWSVVCAVLSLLAVSIALGVFFFLSDGNSQSGSNAAALGLGIVYFLVAPILHLIGIVFGFIGLACDGGKAAALIGLLLNVLLVLIGAGLAYAGLRGMAAFT